MDFFLLAGFLHIILGDVLIADVSPECPHGWVDGGEMGCFLFQAENVNLSWIEALNECEKLGGFLMEPKTEDQFQFVSSLAFVEESFTGITSWWVGLSDLGHEGSWFWQFSMEPAEEVMWGIHHPDQKPDNVNDCASLTLSHGEYVFEDNNCFETVAPVCQKGGFLATTTSPPSPISTATTLPECPLDWAKFERSCFQYFPTYMNWVAAEMKCIAFGGHLASVHSKEENDFLESTFSNVIDIDNGGFEYIWIGGQIGVYPGYWNQFTWIDGSNTDYVNWVSGQPDSQSYLGLDGKFMWRDLDDATFTFLCRITY